jgi:hypothetical protein
MLAGACVGAFVSGIAGFAFALVALSFWVWWIDPHLLAPLAVFGSIVSQITSFGAVRRGFQWNRVTPFLIGGTLGVPVGVWLLDYIDLNAFRITVGCVLVGYCSFLLFCRSIRPVLFGGRSADGCVGVVGGVMGGLAGLTGPAPTLWCTLRGWDKDVQRCVFQTFNVVMQAIALVTYWIHGTLTVPVLKLFALMLPVLILPAWMGARLYQHINEQLFRKLILVLLVVSGAVMLISTALRKG